MPGRHGRLTDLVALGEDRLKPPHDSLSLLVLSGSAGRGGVLVIWIFRFGTHRFVLHFSSSCRGFAGISASSCEFVF